jgi:hypothetical protein
MVVVQGLTDMKGRRCHEVRERFISDGPACVQDMALEATGADYGCERESYWLGRWDDDLSGLEEMLVNLYSNFGWKIEEAKGWEVRSSRHGEAKIGGF